MAGVVGLVVVAYMVAVAVVAVVATASAGLVQVAKAAQGQSLSATPSHFVAYRSYSPIRRLCCHYLCRGMENTALGNTRLSPLVKPTSCNTISAELFMPTVPCARTSLALVPSVSPD